MAATASLRPLLHHTAAVPSAAATQKPNSHTLHLPVAQLHLPKIQTLAQLHLPKIQTLQIKTPLSLHPFPSASPFLLRTANDVYTETEDDYDDEEDGEEAEQEPQQPPSPKSPAAGDERRLYVGNLPYSLTSAQLTEIFSQAGTVAAVEIVYDRVTDRSRGFGFVTMGSKDEASNAIRMFDGALVGGRTAKVNFPEVPRGGEREVLGPRTRRGSGGFTDSPYKVYAGNLGWIVTSESLRDAFADQPGLLGAKVIYNRGSGLSRGFGFISFASSEEAQAAIDNMNEKELGGRPLRLSIAAGRTSGADQPKEQLSAAEF